MCKKGRNGTNTKRSSKVSAVETGVSRRAFSVASQTEAMAYSQRTKGKAPREEIKGKKKQKPQRKLEDVYKRSWENIRLTAKAKRENDTLLTRY